MTRHEPVDEARLIEMFGEIETPSSVDGWRDRVEPENVDDPSHELDPARVVVPLPERWLREHRRASAVMAAVVALIVGMGGVLIVSQVLSDAPPADDPTMIIDGPDGTGTPTSPVPTSPTSPTQPTSPPVVPGAATQGRPGDGGSGGGGGGNPPAGGQPVWGPMTGYPSPANTGVPSGSALTRHEGDLVVDTPGAVITDLRITGTVWVNAPDVTLRRVVIESVGGTNSVEMGAPRLRIQDSELTAVMGQAIGVGAEGLTLIRNTISADDFAATLPSGSDLIENHVTGAGFTVAGGVTGIRLLHNTFDQIRLDDYGAPITGVTVADNDLRQIGAPTQSGSSGIHVTDNVFHGDTPSIGWKADGPDWVWTGNTHRDTGEPVSP